jgi:hypothetical protein
MAAPAHIARENGKKGGRPKGALTKMSLAKARELADKNETPLDVMVDNMNFWRKRANELTDVMQEKLNNLVEMPITNKEEQDAFVKAMQEFNKIAAHMIAARAQAQSCAVDAAPYVHPKLTSVAIKNPQQNVKIQMALAVAVTQVLEDDGPAKSKQLNGHAA